MLVAKIEWLEGVHRWRNGSVCWETATTSLAPGPSDLSRAQRTLNKIRSYPLSAELALGDVDRWLIQRQARLELAKQLARIAGDDIARLAGAARSGKPDAMERVAALLTAEALCLNRLPVSPCATLAACGERALPATLAVMEGAAQPQVARALAALTVGAIRKSAGDSRSNAGPRAADPWLRRAVGWGRSCGIPGEPALVAALLEESEQVADRVLVALNGRIAFALEPGLLRELLASGMSPGQAAELAEAAADGQAVAERLMDHRVLLPDSGRSRKEAASVLDAWTAQQVELLRDLYAQYARNTRDPAALQAATRSALGLLSLAPFSTYAANQVQQCLEVGLELPPSLQADWLKLLAEDKERLWRDDPDQPRSPHETESGSLARRLDNAWSRRGLPCHRLLSACGSASIVREALELGVELTLENRKLIDNDAYRLLLSVVREFSKGNRPAFLWELREMVATYPSGVSARAALEPLVAAVRRAPEGTQAELLGALIDKVHCADRLRSGMPARLARLVTHLLRFNPSNGPWEVNWPAIEAAVALDQARPDAAGAWLERLFDEFSKWRRADPALVSRVDRLEYGVTLGVAIAGDDLALFLSIVRVALTRITSFDLYKLRSGLKALATYPLLQASVAALFPDQPHRCLDLLVRVGAATRLDAKILAPLGELRVDLGGNELVDQWDGVSELDPALRELALEYRWWCGGAAQLPAAVLRALSLPQRLRGELAYLEARTAVAEVPARMATRITNLRSRLGDPAALQETVRREVAEALTLATNEARLTALEQRVTACFRARLEQVAGPLPDDLEMNEDWLNVALLSTSLEHNRRLLGRLVRGCLEGDRRRPERHPENVRFLEALAGRGVNVPAWLGTHPRRYHCAEAQGGWLHLRLERDPLQILHMGNYFDTCLSYDGCNSFSAVTNACELNKRVLYASDGAGRVVGRKLIALNEDGELVGFRTYTALSDSAGNQVLTAIVREYVGQFAEQCGLQLAEKGPVPRLFAEAWYDDGIVSWEEPASCGVRKPGGRRTPSPSPTEAPSPELAS
jgi:hypothetical protein